MGGGVGSANRSPGVDFPVIADPATMARVSIRGRRSGLLAARAWLARASIRGTLQLPVGHQRSTSLSSPLLLPRSKKVWSAFRHTFPSMAGKHHGLVCFFFVCLPPHAY